MTWTKWKASEVDLNPASIGTRERGLAFRAQVRGNRFHHEDAFELAGRMTLTVYLDRASDEDKLSRWASRDGSSPSPSRARG